MEIVPACDNILKQMAEVIDQIDDEYYSKPSSTLHGSTIGQHFRHAIEFFECLKNGDSSGEINYDKRDHDKNIETSRILAMEVISRLRNFIRTADANKALILQVSYNPEGNNTVAVVSNMAREIVYNIEHVVHHMALVKIGIKELMPALQLPHDFGVAISTIKYHRSRA